MTDSTTPLPIGRRSLLTMAAAATAAATAGVATGTASATASTGRRPNFVIILADDLGYGATGPYGQEVIKTPHLDRLAAEGIRFTNGYSGAPVCAPSRCTLLTGMHTGHSRVRDNSFTATGIQPRLLAEDVTFGEVLRAAGYRTGVFGKWGFGDDDAYLPLSEGVGCLNEPADSGGPVGDLSANVGDPSHPLQKGFDEFVGLVRHHHASEGYWPSYVWKDNERVLLPENAGESRATYAPELYVDAALDFIERHQSAPFCLLLTPQLVHWPDHVPSTAAYVDKPWTLEQKRYAAQHTLLDSYVGKVVDRLERLGLDDRTIVVFASDNGPTVERAASGSGDCTDQLGPAPDAALGDKIWQTTGGLRSEKHSLYEGGIRVPMIVWGPGVVRDDGATVSDRPWYFPDLLPTLADFAGVTAPSDVDGVSIRSWITGEPMSAPAHPPLFWERPPDVSNLDQLLPGAVTYGEAARMGRWKGLRSSPTGDPTAPDGRWVFELYDLDADRGETTNLVLLHPDVRAKLETVMDTSHATAPYPRETYVPQRTWNAWRG